MTLPSPPDKDADTPRVAIVVRTKDRPRLLRRAVDSISNQTLTAWECVIVNDGGDPKAAESAVEHLDDSVRSQFSFVHSPESRGRWTSANAGVLATSAPLLVLHDDDDTWHPEFLERAATYLENKPDRAGVVSRIQIVWERQNADGNFDVEGREIFQPQLQDLLLTDALLFNRFVPIGFVYRRSLHAELGLYDEQLPVVGDWAFNLKVLSRGSLEYLGTQPYAFWHQRASATGPAGNSVTAHSGDHDRFDARIRDEALREHVEQAGPGLALYLTKFMDQRFLDVESALRAEVRALREVVERGTAFQRALRSVRRTLTPRDRHPD